MSIATFNRNRINGGFTLVEVLVSVGIFSLAMVVVSQSFFYSIKAERRLVANSQMINEMTYNLEHIARGIRMAKKDTVPDCLSAKNLNFEIPAADISGGVAHGIKFKTPGQVNSDCVRYYLSGGVLRESRVTGTVPPVVFDLPLTSPDITVEEFSIYAFDQVVGSNTFFGGIGWSQDLPDYLQPRVNLFIRARDKTGQVMQVQTTVSQRNPDIRKP